MSDNNCTRIEFGDESELKMSDVLGDGMRDDKDDQVLYRPRQTEECPDCGAAQGEYHTKGCDIEQCPVCKRQSISCDHDTISNEVECEWGDIGAYAIVERAVNFCPSCGASAESTDVPTQFRCSESEELFYVEQE